MTRADAVFYYCLFLGLMQTYASLVFFEPRFHSYSGLSYIHFSAFTGNLIYARDLNLQLSLADLNICAGFLLDIRIFLILCFFRIQLILLLMA